jgi:hypothetical protein
MTKCQAFAGHFLPNQVDCNWTHYPLRARADQASSACTLAAKVVAARRALLKQRADRSFAAPRMRVHPPTR